MQVLNLTLSGGEPLVNPDFWCIGRRARKLGFVVRVKSNGHVLNRAMANRLKADVDPFNVDISLHGACPETHDRQTRIPGSFARLMENLRTMKALGIRIRLNSPVTAWNEYEIEEMFALADDLCLPLSVDTRVTPRDDDDTTPLNISTSVEGLRAVLRLQKARAKSLVDSQVRPNSDPEVESRHHCGAGSSTLSIDPFGIVYPCVQWRRVIGNVHTDRIQTLWTGSAELMRIRKVTEKVRGNLQTREDGGRPLGFCPALAEQRTGSPLLLDPETCKRLEAYNTCGDA